MSNGNQAPDAGLAYLKTLTLEHVKMAPATGREATDEFLNGEGDALLVAESGAIDAEIHNQSLMHVTPSRTIKVANLVAVIKDGPHVDAATRLKDYVYTPEAQRLWARARLRPPIPRSRPSPPPSFRCPRSSGPSTIWAAGPPPTPGSSTARTAPSQRSHPVTA
jgi:sulfate/thiosulfate transport system substrate-binding protein